MTETTHFPPPICDYEGSNYRTDFWEGRGRDYEDRAERVALRRLLPLNGGRRLLEVGAGFGRLTEEYHAWEQVVLLDYSFSQLQYARDQFGDNGRFVYVAADAYHLPFKPGVFDGATMIRTIHHMREPERVLTGLRRVLAPGGLFLLEHASKRNLKAMLRYALGQQDWSPYTPEQNEFVELNIAFHPQTMLDHLRSAGFEPVRRTPVSFLRLGLLKNTVPTGLLVVLDSLLQQTTFFYTPSIFVLNIAAGPGPDNTGLPLTEPDRLFVSPLTGAPLIRDGDLLMDSMTGASWAVRDGIYDFKAPLSDASVGGS